MTTHKSFECRSSGGNGYCFPIDFAFNCPVGLQPPVICQRDRPNCIYDAEILIIIFNKYPVQICKVFQAVYLGKIFQQYSINRWVDNRTGKSFASARENNRCFKINGYHLRGTYHFISKAVTQIYKQFTTYGKPPKMHSKPTFDQAPWLYDRYHLLLTR